jgi:hypothetical protein
MPMGRQYDAIDDTIAAWVAKQHLFFVGSAPSGGEGHVNISPKGGMGTFRILGPNLVAYLDTIGSGIETISHLKENGRIVVMFCAFEGAPKIVRFHGRGRPVELGTAEFDGLVTHFDVSDELRPLVRSIIVVDVTRVSDSCGFGVPRMDFVEERQQLFRWAETKEAKHGDGWLEKYKQENNLRSIDALPGLDLPEATPEEDLARFSSAGRAL